MFDSIKISISIREEINIVMPSTPSLISVMAHSGNEANLFDFILPGQVATPTIHFNTEKWYFKGWHV